MLRCVPHWRAPHPPIKCASSATSRLRDSQSVWAITPSCQSLAVARPPLHLMTSAFLSATSFTFRASRCHSTAYGNTSLNPPPVVLFFFLEKLVKHYTPFMSTFHSSLPKNSISKYFNLFATLFFVPHLIVVIIKLSHFYVTTTLLPFPLRNHFSNTSPK